MGNWPGPMGATTASESARALVAAIAADIAKAADSKRSADWIFMGLFDTAPAQSCGASERGVCRTTTALTVRRLRPIQDQNCSAANASADSPPAQIVRAMPPAWVNRQTA